MLECQRGYYTFTFKINPDLNGGYIEAFNQGGEPWWWVCNKPGDTFCDGPAAGDVDLTGAVLIAVHEWDEKIWPKTVDTPMESA